MSLKLKLKTGSRRSERTASVPGPAGTNTLRHLLERHATLEASASHAELSGSASVIMRSPPPPLVLLVVKQDAARDRLLRVLGDAGANIDEAQGVSVALEKVQARRHPIVLTDSAELTRQLRPQDGTRGPHVILVSDEWSSESADGYRIGATECLGTEASYECIHARLGMARRIADLEASLQLTAAQNRKLSTIDELTGVASRRSSAAIFPRSRARRALSRPAVPDHVRYRPFQTHQ